MAGDMHGKGACVVGGGMHGRGGMCGKGGVCGRGWHAWQGGHVWQWVAYMQHTPQQILRDTVNERAVRILLECILVISGCSL